MINDKQIEEALKNIAELKSAVNNKLTDLRPALINKSFAKSILINNIFFTIVTIISIVGTKKYGSISNAPIFYLLSIISLITVSVIYLVYKKLKAIETSQENALGNLIRHKAFYKLYINCLFSFFTAFIIYLGLKYKFDGLVNTSWLLLPLLLFAYGVDLILSGNAIFLKEMVIAGYLVIILASITLFLFNGSILIWSMVTVTIVLFIMYFSILAAIKRKE